MGCHEVCLLGPEVDYIHDCVIAVGIWEFADKVNAHYVPRSIRDGDWMKFAIKLVSQRLCATAQITGLCVETNLPAKTRPPVAP